MIITVMTVTILHHNHALMCIGTQEKSFVTVEYVCSEDDIAHVHGGTGMCVMTLNFINLPKR